MLNKRILGPPGVPKISSPVKSLEVGRQQQLSCYTKAGNPPALLQWYNGDQLLESQYR